MFLHQPSGLYLTLFRAYDPYSGRWLSRDPAGEQGKDVPTSAAILNEISPASGSPSLQSGTLPALPPTSTLQADHILRITERLLNPTSGNFGDITGINLYAYVGENPIDRVDSYGEAWGPENCQNVECGAPHGGTYSPLCPQCYNRLKGGESPPILLENGRRLTCPDDLDDED
jgi:RHS repeat-associated protein